MAAVALWRISAWQSRVVLRVKGPQHGWNEGLHLFEGLQDRAKPYGGATRSTRTQQERSDTLRDTERGVGGEGLGL